MKLKIYRPCALNLCVPFINTLCAEENLKKPNPQEFDECSWNELNLLLVKCHCFYYHRFPNSLCMILSLRKRAEYIMNSDTKMLASMLNQIKKVKNAARWFYQTSCKRNIDLSLRSHSKFMSQETHWYSWLSMVLCPIR